jgi:hypothetical protein
MLLQRRSFFLVYKTLYIQKEQTAGGKTDQATRKFPRLFCFGFKEELFLFWMIVKQWSYNFIKMLWSGVSQKCQKPALENVLTRIEVMQLQRMLCTVKTTNWSKDKVDRISLYVPFHSNMRLKGTSPEKSQQDPHVKWFLFGPEITSVSI